MHNRFFVFCGVTLRAALSFQFSSDVDGIHFFYLNTEDFFYCLLDFHFVRVTRNDESVSLVCNARVTLFAEYRFDDNVVGFQYSAYASSIFFTASAVTSSVAFATTS